MNLRTAIVKKLKPAQFQKSMYTLLDFYGEPTKLIRTNLDFFWKKLIAEAPKQESALQGEHEVAKSRPSELSTMSSEMRAREVSKAVAISHTRRGKETLL